MNMFNILKNFLTNKKMGGLSLAVFALAFLLAGFGMASAFHGTSALQMKSATASTAVPAPAAAVPGSFADLAKRLSPTVVNVKVTKIEKVGPSPMFQFPEGPFGDFFKQFPNMIPQGPENRQTQGTGSGVIISADGYILTNNHVVEGAKEVTVTVGDKEEYKAEVVGRDPKTDLAVLKIKPKENLPAAQLGNSDQINVGDWVLAIGSPFGLSHTVTSGIVSAKGRVIGAGPYDNFIQTDASINPGNSGGPLFNMNGEVVGINTAILPYGQGIGFAIPINTAEQIIPQLEAKGEVTRGYLGVSIQSLTPELTKALKLEDSQGALVSEVTPDSPAAKAGIQRGDVIVSFGKKPVEDARALPIMVAGTPVGQEVPITVLRNGEKHQLSVMVGKLPSERAEEGTSIQPTQGKWGLQLQDLGPQLASRLGVKAGQGVVVAGIQNGSPAERAGVHSGDIILEMNRQPVHSVGEAREVVTKASEKDPLLLLVKRDSGTFYVTVTM
jgi:serine protease Do